MNIQDDEAASPLASFTEPLRRIQLREYGIVFVFLALFVTLSFSSDKFFQKQNFFNILDQWSAIGLLACAATICIIAGVFDLSAGAMVSVAAVVACKVANGTTPWLGILAGVGCGLGLGISNGLIVHITKINSFIGTLATGIVFAGLAIIITGGNIVTVTDPQFGVLGQNDLLGLKYTGWVFIGFAVIAGIVLARSRFGRYVYAVGGNAESARLSGIRVGLIRGSCFAVSGLAAGIAGALLASRTTSAQADLGRGMELTAISAAILGGTSIFGGEGAVWRAVLGVLLLAMIGNGFNLLGIDTTYQAIVQGALILVAVAADQLLRRRA
jgi:ribose transport system permease protein